MIFRQNQKGGKSIEGLYEMFLNSTSTDVIFINYFYDENKSLFANILILRRIKADIWHVTGDINYIILGLIGLRSILTIHDIGRYKELKGWRKWLYGWLWIYLPVVLAQRVIVVSKFTKGDLDKYFKLEQDNKISVIYNAINPIFQFSSYDFNTHRPRILQIGTAVHKNMDTLIRALDGTECVLCIIGVLRPEQRILLHRHRIAYENYVNLTLVELQHQYAEADIVVFVSLHEGFGLPIAEAQATGRPVIASRMASIPEVAGSGAHFLMNPLNADELRQAIIRMIYDENYRQTLIEEGLANVSRFVFPRMRADYIDVYNSLMRK